MQGDGEAPGAMSNMTFFEKYGGFGGLYPIVNDFYLAVVQSELLADVFAQVDIAALVDHQTKFLAAVLGGPGDYEVDYLEQVHRHLSISDSQFDEVGRLLAEALQQHGVEAADIDAVMAFVASTRAAIVS